MAVPYTALLLYLYFALHSSLVAILGLALPYIYIVVFPGFFHDETICKETKDVYKDRSVFGIGIRAHMALTKETSS